MTRTGRCTLRARWASIPISRCGRSSTAGGLRAGNSCSGRPAFDRRPKELLYAWLAATLLSGLPSTLYAFATGRDVLEATRAAAAMFAWSGRLLIDAGSVHASVSLFWAALLWFSLPRRYVAVWAIAAATLIGVLDLRLIAPLFFPEVAALEFWPQMADHLMWGLCFGVVLERAKKIGG